MKKSLMIKDEEWSWRYEIRDAWAILKNGEE